MPAAPPVTSDIAREKLVLLGRSLKSERKKQGVSAVATAEAAGISRVTLHRIERGEPSVTIAAWLAVASALGLRLELLESSRPAAPPKLPEHLRLDDYPQLKNLAWQLKGSAELTPEEAFALYERNWRHIDRASLSTRETALIDDLSTAFGGGRLLV